MACIKKPQLLHDILTDKLARDDLGLTDVDNNI